MHGGDRRRARALVPGVGDPGRRLQCDDDRRSRRDRRHVVVVAASVPSTAHGSSARSRARLPDRPRRCSSSTTRTRLGHGSGRLCRATCAAVPGTSRSSRASKPPLRVRPHEAARRGTLRRLERHPRRRRPRCWPARVATLPTSIDAGLLHAAFLRSSEPHARVTRIDVAAARRLNRRHCRHHRRGDEADHQPLSQPCHGSTASTHRYYWALAIGPRPHGRRSDRARRRRSRATSPRTRSSSSTSTYEPLEAIADIEAALDAGKPKLWDRADGNTLMNTTKQYGDVAAAFAGADRVITATFDCHRHSNQPMETRGCVAEIDATTPRADLAFGHAEHPRAEVVPRVSSRAGSPSRNRSSGCRSTATERRAFVAGHTEVRPREPTDAHRRRLLGIRISMRRDPSTVVHLLRGGLGLIAKDGTKIPEVEAQRHRRRLRRKGVFSHEEIAVCAAALQLGRSVKWIEDRNEHLAVGGHAREETDADRGRGEGRRRGPRPSVSTSPSSTAPTRRLPFPQRCSRRSCES